MTDKAIQPVEKSMGLINPNQQIEFGRQCAKALVDIINSKPKKVIIKGEQYLEYEDWQTIARFFNTTVGTESTNMILKNGKFSGYQATAVVYNQAGIKIGGAEASCFVEEMNWGNKPEFQLKSMAQTRACAKALRNIFGWVVVLAGYKATPSEEMTDIPPAEVTYTPAKTHANYRAERVEGKVCPDCGLGTIKKSMKGALYCDRKCWLQQGGAK